MTVKSKRGRRRYIVFEVGPEVNGGALSRAVFGLGPQIKVISCREGMAAIRCAPIDTERVIATVLSSFPGSRSVRTSGTLKSLRDRYGSLKKERRPPVGPGKGGH